MGEGMTVGPDLTPPEVPRYALDPSWALERRRLGLLEAVFDPDSARACLADPDYRDLSPAIVGASGRR